MEDSRRAKKMRYSEVEDKAMFLYAIKHKRGLLGTKLWENAETLGITSHPSNSMRNRFKTKIAPNFTKYSTLYREEVEAILRETDDVDISENSLSSVGSKEETSDEDVHMNIDTPTRYWRPPNSNVLLARHVNLSIDRNAVSRYSIKFDEKMLLLLEMARLRREKYKRLLLLSSTLQNLDLTAIKWIQRTTKEYNTSYRTVLQTLEKCGGSSLLAMQKLNELQTSPGYGNTKSTKQRFG